MFVVVPTGVVSTAVVATMRTLVVSRQGPCRHGPRNSPKRVRATERTVRARWKAPWACVSCAGAAIVAMKLVERGAFQDAAITAALMAPASTPGCSGARCIAGVCVCVCACVRVCVCVCVRARARVRTSSRSTPGRADNLSDLRAQVAANQRGIGLVHELIAEHGGDTVAAYACMRCAVVVCGVVDRC